MSTADGAEPRQEIIIVRRNHHDHDEGHHGGVWKIAFADFMTAMMCFFLVMWLINAANEETRAAVASYFNPVPLVDRSSSRKGLEDVGDGPDEPGYTSNDPVEGKTKQGHNGKGNPGTAQDKQTGSNEKPNKAEEAKNSDQKLFADPYAVLAEIAAETGTRQNISAKGEGGVQTAGPATGASGGESYRDPFAPDFWSQQVSTPLPEASAENPKTDNEATKPGETAAQAQQTAKDGTAAKDPAMAKKAAAEEIEQAEKQDKKPTDATVKAAEDVKKQIAQAFKPGDAVADGVSVEATDKGVVISVTDSFNFGMFEIGSAVPRRELVLAMEKIGHIVMEQKGRIAIQGYTDARPFRGDYDNWRLSTARAHSAYYMLVRGGLDEGRVKEVSGFADREPKNKADPLAAVNRRIEILLEAGG
ncbi:MULTISPECIES: MotB family protein [Phyllobacteriaceae]|jgi:chemotaxis protein MotB|uniref:Flagellar motor protein MotB n=1 Tax=Mesorhizobium hungaricum TaxID=1566387 RepID=A0A1C2EA78_9HYPH|nr:MULTISPECIES: MotB family protein [Mesorhizobium]MBN9237148.1 MotB family protein [Mesorhizobium sp.]MDQ0329352.1 chemotaxis protein MotB [Mesorhizobium sp. YL-MeA3-2017]OCX23891.1 flagellar motor protein MotB [Mesorhizobium hungaricum]